MKTGKIQPQMTQMNTDSNASEKHLRPSAQSAVPLLPNAETCRRIAEIIDKFDTIEAEARETDKALRKNLRKIGV